MVYFWLCCAVLFGVLEALTVALVSVWFIVGSLAALLCAWLGLNIWIQVGVFLVVSGAMMLALRRFVKTRVDSRKVATNADTVIGKVAVVTENVDNVLGTGAVTVDGKPWTARSLSGAVLNKGSYVRPVAIEGVKLIVEEIKED
ncbi:MAG: NfeD family protein [Oscillospiraceae bacterium]|nr:NfeD family protein [Oscillospiraceae bacterium]